MALTRIMGAMARILGIKTRRIIPQEDRVAVRASRSIFEGAKLMLDNPDSRLEIFNEAQSFGVHIVEVHFYSPIPDTRRIPESTWTTRYDDLPNLRIDERKIIGLLRECAPYAEELADISMQGGPHAYHWGNSNFNGSDASLLYAMLRKYRPQTVIEVGCGFSTLMGLRAIRKNGFGNYLCIEPYPDDAIIRLAERGDVTLMRAQVQDVPLEHFAKLRENDVLFIDSTHVVRTGGDVIYEILKILPALKPGVLVHFHDIMFPFEMPRTWVEKKMIFWSEQYLLIAFLAFNDQFEMLIPNYACAEGALRKVSSEVFPHTPVIGGGSFWFRRRHNPT